MRRLELVLGGLDRFVRLNAAAAGDVDGALTKLGRLAARSMRG
jgi:hypothetical protein